MGDKVKYYKNAAWYYEISTQDFVFFPGGYLEPGIINEDKDLLRIDSHLADMLITFMDKEGLLPIKISQESRTEDLKIVHRLIDLMDKGKE